jgi:CAP-Gly domain-containing linker protein 1
MEDVIEDARAASEKEEAAFRERMRRLKEKEDGMKKELSEGRKEVERMTTSELTARNRVEEIEEALRESTVALENARAEVEALRAEMAVSLFTTTVHGADTFQNVDSLVGDISEGDLSSRVAELAHRASIDRTRSEQEISRLTDMLQELRPGVNRRDVDLESQVFTVSRLYIGIFLSRWPF